MNDEEFWEKVKNDQWMEKQIIDYEKIKNLNPVIQPEEIESGFSEKFEHDGD